jgi:hypothetical protein
MVGAFQDGRPDGAKVKQGACVYNRQIHLKILAFNLGLI